MSRRKELEGAQVTVARPQNLTFQIALPIWAWLPLTGQLVTDALVGRRGWALWAAHAAALVSAFTAQSPQAHARGDPGASRSCPAGVRGARAPGPHGDARGLWGAHEKASCGAVAPLPSHPPLRSREPGTLACASPRPTRV